MPAKPIPKTNPAPTAPVSRPIKKSAASPIISDSDIITTPSDGKVSSPENAYVVEQGDVVRNTEYSNEAIVIGEKEVLS